MELAHSLLLNEEALKKIPDSKKPVFVFEWLRFLDKVLVAAQKSDIKEGQQKLVDQLTSQLYGNPGPPARKLLARCLATLFSVGDTFSLFETISKCNDIIRNKDDSPSYLPTRLAAIACIGGMYEKLGRMVGRSYEETVQLLIKALKNAESTGRCEVMLTLEKVVEGLGNVASGCHKDIYKAARNCMTDRSMSVRTAAAKCLTELVNEASFMYTSELDSVVSLCFRALDGSNYDVRCAVGKLLGQLLAAALQPKQKLQVVSKTKQPRLEDLLMMLSQGFVKGTSGFLKGTAGEIIKGGGAVNREIRVGVTHAYVEFVKCMGGTWLERNISVFLDHILNLVANPKVTPTHVDAVYARKCVQFILRTLIGSLLGEKAQIAAAKAIKLIVIKQMDTISAEAMADSADKSQNIDVAASQHILVCALHELGSLVQSLGTSAAPLVSEPQTGIIQPVISVLIHISPAARLAAAWCLRNIAVALSSYLTPLLDQCMTSLTKLKSSPEAVSGYCYAIAALLGGVHQCPLGIPHVLGKKIFSLAEELLRTASQNSRLSLQRTQSGWLLLGALMTLGPPVVKNHLPRMLLLWRNAFPRSTKELESEKSRGDAFTWQVTLEGRAGALAAMYSFVLHCRELVTEDVTRRLLSPIDCALTMLAHIPVILKMYHGHHLKACAAMVRLRLYDVLSHLPASTFEGAYNPLLRELVAEFTLTDNPANTTTSMLRAMCHVDDSVILGSWLQETDHKAIEDQLEPNRKLDKEHLQPNSASGSGALEHDPLSIYLRCPQGEHPGPLPLGVAVIDSSVRLYGLIFPRVPHKHRLKMLQHFADCIKQAKSTRQQAVQMNIFTAVLCSLKSLADTKTDFGHIEVRKAAVSLVLGALGSSNPILRCAAGEALGRIAQVVEDSRFIAEMAQYSFDKLKSARDVVSRTGHSLALGCLHRYVGGMGSGQHLNTSVSILLALAQDSGSPVVQVWALHALGLIADCGGPMFRSYVEPTLSLVLSLLLSVPPSNIDVHQCLGKCLSALITTIGPELQGNSGSLATARLYCLICCAIMQDHPDSLVQAEAIACLQQLHMFAPRHVNLTSLVPHLCSTLNSSHLLLRRAAVACLRQLSQREAREISEHALTLVTDSKDSKGAITITETGLEGALFALLDRETDDKLCKDVHDTIISMLQSLAAENLTRWFTLVKDVLAAATETGTPIDSPAEEQTADKDDDEEDDDVDVQFKAPEQDITHPLVAPRWPTRVFATQCMRKIITVCEGGRAHFDLALAKEMKITNGKGDFLVLHLSELVRVAFIAATSDSDKLRLAGLATLQDVIVRFCKVPEPEFPGHVILEQYQAQVGAALRPAFSPDTPSDVTAAACEVCSTWIGSGVARDLNDLRRVHQLLVSSLEKLKIGKGKTQLYNESASTMEKLAVLKAWAEVYIVAMNREKEKASAPPPEEGDDDFEEYQTGESLLSLVKPELHSLNKHWLAALKDHALLCLPQEFSSQLPTEGGAFYSVETIESARPHYKKSWAPMLYAVSLFLNEGNPTPPPANERTENGQPIEQPPANMQPEDIDEDRFHLLLGICIEALCSPTSIQPLETVTLCLRAMYCLLDKPWPRSKIGADQSLGIELLNVLHRLLITRESTATHLLVIEVVKQVIKAAQENLEAERTKTTDDPANQENGSAKQISTDKTVLGEGGETGQIVPGKSLVFATLEVCLCVLIRHIPALNPSLPSTGFQLPHRVLRLPEEACQLVSSTLAVMMELPGLCSPKGSVSVLPTILFLTTGVIREMAPRSAESNSVPSTVNAALQALGALCRCPLLHNETCSQDWYRLLQSTIATVLDFAKPDLENDKPGVEESTLLLTLTVFFVSCPAEVMCAPNLLQPTIDVFKETWESKNIMLRLKCTQTLSNIIQHPDKVVSTPFIHALCPSVIENLANYAIKRPEGDADLTMATESVKLLEALIAAAEDNTRIHLVSLLVPILISFLLDGSLYAASKRNSKALHDYALERLMSFGPQYPEHFRTVMTSAPDLRTRLETAIKANQAAKKSKSLAAQQAREESRPVKPSIKLKTDFSNFS